MNDTIINNIFSVTPESFHSVAEAVYRFQQENNVVFREWNNHFSEQLTVNSKQLAVSSEQLAVNSEQIISSEELSASITDKNSLLTDNSSLFTANCSLFTANCSLLTANCSLLSAHCFLPISFFKTNKIVTTEFTPEAIFESSGTSQTINSQHLVKDLSIYHKSFFEAFKLFYGDIKEWCIIGLLPSYLERNNSSLTMMVDELIKASNNPDSGFYLYDFDKLEKVLLKQEAAQQKTLLLGVTFALLDFAEQRTLKLNYTTIMETGGMKGRRKELTRAEVHAIICNGFGVDKVHSEYGMTELLSQAYSLGDGRFICPPWMKVLVRDEDDPLTIRETGRGVLNVIDLANLYSCSFIATDDVGIVYEDGSFEVWGRLDNSDIRGCSLLVV